MTTQPRDTSRQPVAAAIAALAVLLIAFVVEVSDGVVQIVYTQGQTLKSLDGFDYALPALGWAVPFALWQLVPLAAGIFLSFWLILPIRRRQRVRVVVWRALVALLIGLVIATAVAWMRLVASDLPVSPTQGQEVDNRYYILVLGGLAHSAWVLFSASFALVVATGLALWGWLDSRPDPSNDEAEPTPDRDSEAETAAAIVVGV